MDRSRIATTFITAGAITLSVIGAQSAHSAGEKEAYRSPGAQKEVLLDEPLPGTDGKIVSISRLTMPAGWVGGKHYHTGPVYVYVLEGSFTIDEKGKERRTFKAGDMYKEPIGMPMQARNANASEPLKVLVFQVSPKGEPTMVKVQ